MKSSRQNEDHIFVSSPSPPGGLRPSTDLTRGTTYPPSSTSSSSPPIPLEPSAPQPKRFVRFDVDDELAGSVGFVSRDNDERWTYDEDFLNSSDDDDFAHAVEGGTAPLLTNIAAPSVVFAGLDNDNFEDPASRSGMKMAFMNMANSIIGAGIIVINSKLSGANSFQSTVSACFGKWGLISISLAQWAFAFGGMIAFCIIIGDTIPHVLAALFPRLKDMSILWLLTNRRAVIVLCVVGISYPLSLYRDIAKLAKASALALVSMLVIVVTVITQGFFVANELRGSLSGPLLTLNSGVFQAIGVISFDHNSLLIYGSLRKPTLDRFARVTHYSTGISMVACMGMAFAGFLTFGDKTMGNVLNNFPNSNLMVNIARFCFGLNMLTTLPLEAFVMIGYWYPGSPFEMRRHIIFTTGLIISALLISLFTCDLGAVFELIGATSACALAYILPPLCYIKLSTRSWRTVLAWGCVGFGVLVLVISLVQAVVKILEGNEKAMTCEW
ncbi:hypothetical protein TWF192_009414 [Orbilia oligospora]|uniref:Amino acid transporter transmembrane domain-containing protein n=1 Tax=Orbilia oligospora TaxID=2813651 RepID=A0A6G1M087_ORBOL|nr:hypothetical protein TWF679_000859 [Orbilia oligospora]KAF3240739.1 hypothetical protein TWF192_009414 [Orbilia oligospora]